METAPEHASGVRYPQNARLRCWANAAATHAPSLRTACLYGRTHSDARAHTHPRKKTHTRTHSSTETHALVRVWTAKWMSSQHNPALQEWFSMLPDAQMCKWNRVTHFNRGGGERGRGRACVCSWVNSEVGALRSMETHVRYEWIKSDSTQVGIMRWFLFF